MTSSSCHEEKTGSWVLALFAVTGIFILLNLDLVTMTSLFKWDAWNSGWPWFSFLADNLRNFRLPLWDPHLYCGFPFFAEPQTGTFHPVYLFVAWLGGGGAVVYQYFWLAHWYWAVLGFFMLARRMGFSPWATVAGALAFGFSGFFIGNAQHTTFIIAVSWFPWTLLALDKSYHVHVAYSVLAGICLGLASPGPHMAIYCVTMIVVWCALQYREIKKTIVVLGIAGAVGALIVSPSILSFMVEMKGYTDRVGSLSVDDACNTHRFLLTGLVSLLSPGLTVAYPDQLGSNIPNVPMMNAYPGVLGVVAIVVVLCDGTLRNRWKWLLAFMLIAFLLSLGSTGLLRVVGYYVLPPLRFTRHSSLFRVFWLFGGAILVSALIDKILCSEPDERQKLANVALIASLVFAYGALCATVWAVLTPTHAALYEFGQVLAVPNSVSVALEHASPPMFVAALFAGAFFVYGRTKNTELLVALLVALVVVDSAAHEFTNNGTRSWGGAARAAAADLEQVHRERLDIPLSGEEKRARGPILHNLGNFDRKFYIRSHIAAQNQKLNLLIGGIWPPFQDTAFLAGLEQLPRFWLTPRVTYAAEEDQEALRTLRDQDGSEVPIFVHSSAVRGSNEAQKVVKPGTFGKVATLAYQPDEINLAVEAPEKCWLYASERWAPGWKAYLDGNEVPIYKANFAFRAVAVPAGAHSLVMRYEPRIYKPLLVVSWSTILFGLGLWATIIYRARSGVRRGDRGEPRHAGI